jgi:WD40 repeat protein
MQLDVQTTSPAELKPGPIEPYPGPRSFQKEQREFFFGRDEEVDELVSMITAHSAVLLYSQSGAGKTSLLNAQLIPRLEEVEHFNVLPPMRVKGELPATVKIGKNSNIFVLNALTSTGNFDPTTAKQDITFHEFLKTCAQPTNQYGEVSPTVLVFDQFEELFTSYPGRWADREDFFAQIGEAIEGNRKKGIPENPLIRVVFCMREDYIAELDPYLPLLPEKLRSRFRLEHLREKKALAAITKPLEKTNRSYAPGVAEQLVKNLLRIPNQSITGTQTMGLYVEPVQLQVVCQSLWDALEPGETVITAKHLEKYGDVNQALSSFFERSIKSVVKDTEVKEEYLRRWFGDTLITAEGTRAPVNRGKDSTGGMPNAAVDKLEAMRLIKGEWKGTNVRWYELAHDRFIEPIRRSNDKWLANQSRGEQIRLRLEAKASKWQPGNKLLDADELLEARNLVRADNASLSLRALVDASRAASQKRRNRLLFVVIVVCVVLALTFLLMAIFATFTASLAWKNGKAADASARDALASARKAQSSLIALKARALLDSDPELSVLLADEAIRLAETDEAKDVIRAGLLSLSNVDGALRKPGAKLATAEFSPDGNFILTRTLDFKVTLWNAKTKTVVNELDVKDGAGSAMFSPDGKLIATAGKDGIVRLWDGTTGATVRELQGHSGPVNRAVFSPNGEYIATASADTTVQVWKVATGEHGNPRLGHSAGVSELVFSADGKHFATEAADEKAIIWNVGNDKSVTVTGLTGMNAAIALSHDGKLLATEGGPNTVLGASPKGDYPVTVWDVATGKVKFTLGGHQDSIVAISFSPDDSAIVTCSKDRTARLWDRDGRLVRELVREGTAKTRLLSGDGGKEMNSIVRFSPDGKFLATASADNTVLVWDAFDGKLITALRGHSDAVNSIAFSSDSEFIVSASDDQSARLWPFHHGEDTGRSTIESWDHPAPVTSIAVSPGGLDIAITTGDGKLWLERGGLQRPVPLTGEVDANQRVANVKFSPDGRSLALSRGPVVDIYQLDELREHIESSTSLSLYDKQTPSTDTRTVRHIELNGHSQDVNSVAFNQGGSLIVTASFDGTARVWNAQTGQAVGLVQVQPNKVNSAVFSPDGKFILTSSGDKIVRLWDAGNFAFVRTVGETYSEFVSDAEYSPDGKSIVVASGDTAWILDAQTGTMKLKLQGHTDQVMSASFSPDSKLVVTASADTTARVWNAVTGEGVAVLRDHTGPVIGAIFGADLRRLYTASDDYTARVYPREAFLPLAEIQPLISQRVTRQLTLKERDNYLPKFR